MTNLFQLFSQKDETWQKQQFDRHKMVFLLILCLHQSVKHLETVMIWDCISGGDVVYLVKIDKIMNTEKILM